MAATSDAHATPVQAPTPQPTLADIIAADGQIPDEVPDTDCEPKDIVRSAMLQTCLRDDRSVLAFVGSL